MSREFDGTDQKFSDASYTTIAAMADTLTMAVWFKIEAGEGPADAADNFGIVKIGDQSSTDGFRIAIDDNDPEPDFNGVECRNRGTSTTCNTDPKITVIDDVWTSAVALFTSTSVIDICVNGSFTGDDGDTTTGTANGIDNCTIGALPGNSGVFDFYNGFIAHVALWDVRLTNAEAVAYSRGYHPTVIRPDSLRQYYELNEKSATDNAIDSIEGVNLTHDNSPGVSSDNPPVFYPRPVELWTPAAGAPAATSFPPVKPSMQHLLVR